jgi:hypothetical protein
MSYSGIYAPVRAHYGVIFRPDYSASGLDHFSDTLDPGAPGLFLQMSDMQGAVEFDETRQFVWGVTRETNDQQLHLTRHEYAIVTHESVVINRVSCSLESLPYPYNEDRDYQSNFRRYCRARDGRNHFYYFEYKKTVFDQTNPLDWQVLAREDILQGCDISGQDERVPACDGFDLDRFNQLRQRAEAVIRRNAAVRDEFMAAHYARFAPLEAELRRRIAATFAPREETQ